MADDATLITQVSQAIETYCGQKFSTTAVTEKVDGGGSALVLKYRNIGSVTSITDLYSSSVLSSTEYDVDADGGLIYLDPASNTTSTLLRSPFWGDGRRRYSVVYTTGYASAPADVALATAMLCAEFRDRDDQALKSESIGDYSYTVADIMDGFSEPVKRLLAPHVIRPLP